MGNIIEMPVKDSLQDGTMLFDRYLLEGVLGRGAFGITYIAEDSTLERKVAIKEYAPADLCIRKENKLFPKDAQSEDKFTAGKTRFWNEASITFGIFDVPGICSVYDCFEDNNTVYMVQEYIPGGTLAEAVRRQKRGFGEAKTLELFSDVLIGLAKLHNLGILHLDISPDNLMFDANGKIKLIDFGISSFEKNKSPFGWKPVYSSPEQAAGTASVGPWSDIYSLSGTMFFAITGRTPFGGLRKRLKASPISMNRYCEVSSRTENALRRGLSPLVALRYFSMSMFMEALNVHVPQGLDDDMISQWGSAWLSATTVSVYQKNMQSFLNMGFSLRSRIKTVLCIMVALLLLVGITGFIWSRADNYSYLMLRSELSHVLHPAKRGISQDLAMDTIRYVVSSKELKYIGSEDSPEYIVFKYHYGDSNIYEDYVSLKIEKESKLVKEISMSSTNRERLLRFITICSDVLIPETFVSDSEAQNAVLYAEHSEGNRYQVNFHPKFTFSVDYRQNNDGEKYSASIGYKWWWYE